MKPLASQTAMNEIGRLNRVIDDLKSDKKSLHADVVAQREAIALAAVKLETGNISGAIDTLNGALAYRTAQREPRKNGVKA